MNKREALIWASGFYLCKHLTEELLDGDEDELDQFLLENTWEPFLGFTPNSLYAEIDTLAMSVINFHHEHCPCADRS